MRKTRKAISAPLGVIFGVLLAIILVVLATFIAFNISTTAVKSQSGQLVVVGEPVAFYDTSTNNLSRVTITVKNPSGSPIKITQLIIKGNPIQISDSDVTLADGTSSSTIPAGFSATIDVDVSSAGISVAGDINNGYVEVVIVTDKGTVTTPAQLIGVSS